MCIEVDSELKRFLDYQERDEVMLIGLISMLEDLKETIERNIPSEYDIYILNYFMTLEYPKEYKVLFDISEIIKLKNEILELYSKRK